MSNTNTIEDWAVIHSYTRKQAIADGVLVDVTDQAKFSGFKIPVAVTQTVWGGWIEANRVGGSFEAPPLPHHRTCGDASLVAYGGSL